MKNSKVSIFKKIILLVAALVIMVILGAAIYIASYYRADPMVIKDLSEELKESNGIYTVSQGANGDIILQPENVKVGIIFYPGGKVGYEAYFPLMKTLAKDGYLCVLLKLKANLAIFDVNAADGYIELFPNVDKWFLAGHSLGGAVASMYVNEHPGIYDGLILLASYSTEDLSTDVDAVLSIYGSNDQVLSKEKYNDNIDNLPNLTECVIEGGCHAYFGAYGAQKGDGEPDISREEQIALTAKYIDAFITRTE